MKRRLSLPVALCALALFSSCSDDDPARPDPPLHPPLQAASWEDLCPLFRLAMTSENPARYDSLFSRDFNFVFYPDDVLQYPGEIPPVWGLAEEMESFSNMAADTSVFDVALAWSPGDLGPSTIPGCDGRLVIHDVRLTIETSDDLGRKLTLVAEGEASFDLKKAPWTTAQGDTVWKIARWEDRTVAFPGTPGLLPNAGLSAIEQSTWGRIKVLFFNRKGDLRSEVPGSIEE